MTPDAFEPLIRQFAPGSRLLAAQPLTGGLSAGMTAVTIERADGSLEDFVVRVQGRRSYEYDPGATQRMQLSLETLSGVLPSVPEPVFMDPHGLFFGTPCLVMRRLPGRPNCARDFGPVYAEAASARLAAIHRAGSLAGDLSFLPSFEYRVELELDHTPEALDGPLQEARIREALGSVWPPEPANRPGLLHGDYWPGNLLWEDGRLTGVVDWEETAVGDPLADLAIARLDVLFAFGREAQAAFTRRYLAVSPDIDPGNLPIWDLYAALRPANELQEWAAGWPELGRPDVTLQTMQADHARFVEEAAVRLFTA